MALDTRTVFISYRHASEEARDVTFSLQVRPGPGGGGGGSSMRGGGRGRAPAPAQHAAVTACTWLGCSQLLAQALGPCAARLCLQLVWQQATAARWLSPARTQRLCASMHIQRHACAATVALTPAALPALLQDFKHMLTLCGQMNANIAISFDQPGTPLLVEPHFGGVQVGAGCCPGLLR